MSITQSVSGCWDDSAVQPGQFFSDDFGPSCLSRSSPSRSIKQSPRRPCLAQDPPEVIEIEPWTKRCQELQMGPCLLGFFLAVYPSGSKQLSHVFWKVRSFRPFGNLTVFSVRRSEVWGRVLVPQCFFRWRWYPRPDALPYLSAHVGESDLQ